MHTIRPTAALAALLIALPISIAATPPALAHSPAATVPASTARAKLPRPTGPYAVGRQILELVDQDRPDPWVPSAGPRRLMVSVYYPARAGTGGPAPYMTPDAARLLLDGKLPGNTVPTEAVTTTRTWAESDARPAPGHFPLVLLSPGFTMPRTSLTGLAEDLSSRGYVVALIDHTYENTGTTFPDERTLPCVMCGRLRSPEDWAALDRSRARDVSFVIDRLTARPHPAWRYSRTIDPTRIGMAGHSAGGAATVPALLADGRIRAGVDLDGTMDVTVPASGIDGKPFLLVGHPLPDGAEDPSWAESWTRLDGWKRWLTVTGTNHASFTDFPVLLDALGLPDDGRTVTAPRALQLTREYVAAFFDLQLKGMDRPVLDGPTPDNPEVAFHT
ncbi:alpha/beta hydrolase [Streptomyces sp. SID8366]|uniref:alpha/beta hydrolase family protein n=1 Tax=unclassified Streptomyces TaxID=2593676 RepID=UPI000DB9DB3A|nr:alpha/beta hydrolase [Streptomyces sp. PsTaAH-130]MYU06100.1 alpha/beta hydrolase [Streptomyces sp. SID8366]MYU61673.1 alpha/beta hydrolase [Streptomyces sp. SID69]RAJ64168.1 platelet-activating factor acetylhydrolase isoform II [Streptomyces sp. PsTaAH-130]